ncbi:hypothetical protein EYR36_003103 [Pleurotus pulmonarius]|nr:hypothetical protein EYR36_003103 [Pleurotus pulmonarius]KAF4582538.1 hypothetical protein EYR38_002664 [Pleurotus pulmonarius]
MTVSLIQRPLRGSRIASFYPVKSLPALSSLDSAFQLQEYISLLIRLDVHDVETIVSIPGKSSSNGQQGGAGGESDNGEDGKGTDADKERKAEVMVDKACWIYEQLRRLAQDLTHPLITMLQQECTRATCPEMKAGEWLYLCVAHGTDGAMESCCAIDYILHTLDSATALLNSPRTFPSRLQIPPASHRHFSSLARRLGRIFAHAYFHHREAFEQAEAESSLYARFLALTSKFDLVPPEFLVIPQRFAHHDPAYNGEDHDRMGRDVGPPSLRSASLQPQHPSETRDQHPDLLEPSRTHYDHPLGGPPGLGIDTSAAPTPDTSAPVISDSGNESPRKVGRSRTDTMVLSDVSYITEELAKSDSGSKTAESAAPPPTESNNFRILGRAASSEPPSVNPFDQFLDAPTPDPPAAPDAPTESAQPEPAPAPLDAPRELEFVAEAAHPPVEPQQNVDQPFITPSSSTAPPEAVPEPTAAVVDKPEESKEPIEQPPSLESEATDDSTAAPDETKPEPPVPQSLTVTVEETPSLALEPSEAPLTTPLPADEGQQEPAPQPEASTTAAADTLSTSAQETPAAPDDAPTSAGTAAPETPEKSELADATPGEDPTPAVVADVPPASVESDVSAPSASAEAPVLDSELAASSEPASSESDKAGELEAEVKESTKAEATDSADAPSTT